MKSRVLQTTLTVALLGVVVLGTVWLTYHMQGEEALSQQEHEAVMQAIRQIKPWSWSSEGPPRPNPRYPLCTSPGRMPIIDSHTHIFPEPRSLKTALNIFDHAGVVKFVNKSGGRWGSKRFYAHLAMQRLLGWERFAFFINANWRGLNTEGWAQREAENLARAVELGAVGIKFFKKLGLGARDVQDQLYPVDHPKFFPIWKRAARVGAIVALHTGDPKAFFEPVTPQNERYEELTIAEGWSFYGKDYPSRDKLLRQRDHVLRLFPETTFLGIHLANNPEDIDYVAKLLEKYPNLYVDVSARLGEIGRHDPDKVRRMFVKYQDRILFGTDIFVTPYGFQLGSVSKTEPTIEEAYQFYEDHRRYFETDLKEIDHPTPIQGNWKISAVKLPKAVLLKFYYQNAEKLIFGLQQRNRLRHGDPFKKPASRSTADVVDDRN